MIKVLHVGLSSNPGGVESLILNYHRNIDTTIVQFEYLDMYGDGIAFDKEIVDLGGKIHIVSNFKRHPFLFMKDLKNVIKENNIDILHIHMQSTANILPVLVGLKIPKLKIICHSHSSSTPKGLLRKILHRINVNRLRKLDVLQWACGMKAGNWMWGDSFNSNDIIPNAIDAQKYKYNSELRKIMREKIGYDKERVIGFVGRFGDEKNTLFLIKVLKELLKISKEYRLLTVGGNGDYEIFCDNIRRENLEKYYYSAGIRKSTNEWYQAMDAFLLPSFFEGFPMVGVEAQAAGLPCFLSNRISKEIDITHSISFLPLEEDSACVWANAIHSTLNKWTREVEFPKEYRIDEAAKLLLRKYTEIL